MARGQEYDIWERGGGGEEALVINSIETHIGIPINTAIHLSCTKQIETAWVESIHGIYQVYIPKCCSQDVPGIYQVYTKYSLQVDSYTRYIPA